MSQINQTQGAVGRVTRMAGGCVNRMAGVTLVELLIALVVSLILIGGMGELFIGTKRAYKSQEGLSRIQESARYALDMITKELRMAGYAGCFSVGGVNWTSTLNPGAAAYEYDLTSALTSFEATGAGFVGPPGANFADLPVDVQSADPNFDIITIRRVDAEGFRLTKHQNDSTADVMAGPMGGASAVADGDVLLVSDCSKAAVFQATSTNYQTGTDEQNIVHNTGVGTPGNSQKNLTEDGTAFGPDAAMYRMETVTFYVALSGVEPTNNRGDQVFSLWRKKPNTPAEELLPGVTQFDVLYGEASNGDGAPVKYETAENTNLENVVAVRISLGVDSIDAVTTSASVPGGRISRNFNVSVKLRNRG